MHAAISKHVQRPLTGIARCRKRGRATLRQHWLRGAYRAAGNAKRMIAPPLGAFVMEMRP